MKTKEELNALKEKSEDQKWKKVRKLTDEELEKVADGSDTLDGNVRNAFWRAEIELESIQKKISKSFIKAFPHYLVYQPHYI